MSEGAYLTMRFLGRRSTRRVSVVLAVTALMGVMAACGGDDEEEATGRFKAEPTAGSWRTWVLTSPLDLTVAPPPQAGSAQAEADEQAVKSSSEGRTQAVRDTIDRWNSPLPSQAWMNVAFTFAERGAKNPPLTSRNYALLHVGMYDAMVAAYYWKYRYNIDPPKGGEPLFSVGGDPAYPDATATIAGAASKVLAHLWPSESAPRLDEIADEAGKSRVDAGVNTPSAVAAGLELGRAVADQIIAYAKTDGAGTPWNGRRPAGIGRGPAFWEPPPGSVSPPIDPMAATWKPWVMTSNNQFRPPPPPAYGSAEFRAAAQELVDIKKNLTPEQEALARMWEGGEGSKNPAGITLDENAKDLLAKANASAGAERMTFPRALRATALVTVAMSDAGIAAWDAKYVYWNARPENGIRDLGIDRNWTPLLSTPRFPAYPSGSAGYAGSAQAVMTYLFPEDAEKFLHRAEDQASSRLFAGVHWRYDEVSIDAGRKIADLVIARAKEDGADKPAG